MRVLVTGAGGFLGRHLVAKLVARGDTVVALDLRFDPRLSGPGIATIEGSVADTATVARAVAGCDGVIHAAALTGLWSRHPAAFERINVGGTWRVLAAAGSAGVGRAVLVSSYTTLIAGGRRAPARMVDETCELAPEVLLGPYPRSKRRAELIAAVARVPTAIVLPSAPIGAGDRAPTPPGRLLRDLADRRLPAMIRCGWNFVEVGALADGVIAALDRGQAGRRYLLAGGDMETDEMLARFAAVCGAPMPRLRVPWAIALGAARVEAAIAWLTGRVPAAPVTGVRLAGPAVRFDTGRARAELGFAPPPFEVGLRRALSWLAEEGLLRRRLPALER